MICKNENCTFVFQVLNVLTWKLLKQKKFLPWTFIRFFSMVATQEAQVIPETLRKHFSRSSSIAAPPFLKDTDPLSISICMLPWWEEEDEEVGLAGPFFLGCTTCTSGLSEYKRGQHLWVLLLYTFMLIAQRQKSRYSCTIDHLIRKITLNDKKIYFHILNCQAWR